MSQEKTIARPYAQAVYELATQGDETAKWLGSLGTFSLLSNNNEVADFFNIPNLSVEVAEETISLLVKQVQKDSASALSELVSGVEPEFDLPKKWSEFVKLLSSKGRLSVLPEISAMFIAKVRDANAVLPVTVSSANDITDAEANLLKESLAKKFDKKINLSVEVKPELIGGAMIRVGDTVIDGSVKGKLDAMSQSLLN